MLPDNLPSFFLRSDTTRAGRAYWRVYFRSDDGRRRALSTGVEDDGTDRSRLLALDRVPATLQAALPPAPPPPAVPTFGQLAEGIWIWETSPYIRALLLRDPRALSQEHCYSQHRNLESAIRPWVVSAPGPWAGVALWSVPIDQVTADMLDALVSDLLEAGRSTQTVKHIIQSMTPAFLTAQRRMLIPWSPMRLMTPFAVRSKQRDAFELHEVRKLLSPNSVARIWADPSCRGKVYRDGWRWYSMASLCLVTGARWSAVAALDREDIHLRHTASGVRYYEVEMTKALAAIRGVKVGSKTGSGVTVPVDPWVMELLLPHLPDSGPLFPSWGKHGRIGYRTALTHLKEAMLRIGITPAKARARLLGFHAFRHCFVTQAKLAGLSTDVRRGFTEHADDDTEDGYTHLKAVDLLEVGPLQRSMLAG